MNNIGTKAYPTILQAIHLVVLYMFVQTLVDFPLAMIDYYRDSEWLYHPVKKVLLGVGSVLFILWYGFRKTGHPLRMVFPMDKFNPLLIFFLVLFFLGVQQWLTVINGLVGAALPPPSWFLEMFDKIFESDFGFWGAFIKVVIIAPVVEELIFRGVIMHGLMRNYRSGTAIFFSGLLFALFHLNPWQFPATFVLGIILGWIMIRSRNILLCIAGHAINNLLVLLTVAYAKQLAASPLSQLSVPVVLSFSLVLGVLSVFLLYFFSRNPGQNIQA